MNTETVIIPLTQGKSMLVDAGDAECLVGLRIHAVRIKHCYYACFGQGGREVYVHRFLLNVAERRIEVDHINGDGLDNRRANLRLATHQQNLANQGPRPNNTSGYRGVSWRKDRGRWRAMAETAGKGIHLGYFDDPVEAARAYDAHVRRIYGAYAGVNFQPDGAHEAS